VQVTLAAICDYASISVGEKINVMGVFDTIFAAQFPASHPQLFLAIRVQFGYEDRNTEMRVLVRLENEDGQKSFEATPVGKIGDVPPGEVGNSNLIMQLANLSFPAPGRYSVVIRAGEHEVRLPLRIVRQDR